jgi:hypothetical protein
MEPNKRNKNLNIVNNERNKQSIQLIRSEHTKIL